jgi:hypothetical protein
LDFDKNRFNFRFPHWAAPNSKIVQTRPFTRAILSGQHFEGGEPGMRTEMNLEAVQIRISSASLPAGPIWVVRVH